MSLNLNKKLEKQRKIDSNCIKILLIAFLIGIIIAMCLVSCDESEEKTIDGKIQKAQELQQTDLNNQIGLPDIVNFTEKKNMKYIYELKDRTDLINYMYTRCEMNGKYVYEGKCIGYGLNYATQYSNPEKVVDAEKELGVDWVDHYVLTKPQAEPNGLFLPSSSTATWIIRLNTKGDPFVDYYEPEIIVKHDKQPRRMCVEEMLPDDYDKQ